MNIIIDNAIIHAIDKADSGEFICKLRNQPLPNNAILETMLHDLHQIYTSKSDKGFGYFTQDKPKFFEALNDYRSNKQGFVEFSSIAGQLLKDELGKYSFAQGGYLMLACYTYMTSEYLFVALLNSKSSMTIHENMELFTNSYLDLFNIQLAARIDLTEIQAVPDSKKYISFIRGRAGRKIADFFLDFMGCVEGVNTKEQSTTLIKAVEDFVATTDFNKEDKQNCRNAVYDYCKEQVNDGSLIKVRELSEVLAKEGADEFFPFIQNSDYELDAEFPGSASSLRALKKFIGSGKGVSISFDANLLGDRVIYDPNQDTLIIKGVPANLKEALSRREGDN